MQLPQRRVGVFEGLGAVSAKIVRGFFEFLLGSFQGPHSGVNMRMARLAHRKRECSHDGYASQEAFQGVFHEYNVAKRACLSYRK